MVKKGFWRLILENSSVLFRNVFWEWLFIFLFYLKGCLYRRGIKIDLYGFGVLEFGVMGGRVIEKEIFI